MAGGGGERGWPRGLWAGGRGKKRCSGEAAGAGGGGRGVGLPARRAGAGGARAGGRPRHDQVVRLDDFLARRAPSATGGSPQAMASADVMCLLAA